MFANFAYPWNNGTAMRLKVSVRAYDAEQKMINAEVL